MTEATFSGEEDDFLDVYGDDAPEKSSKDQKSEDSKTVTPKASDEIATNAFSDTSSVNDPNQEQKVEHSKSLETKDDASQTSHENGYQEMTDNDYQHNNSSMYDASSRPDPLQEQELSNIARDDGKMFIGGLNWDTTDEGLKEYFSQFGEVTDVVIMREPNGKSRGFAFLTFKDPRSVQTVITKKHRVDGKIIDPKRAIPREEQEKTAKMFVGGIHSDVTEHEFIKYFSQFGNVLDATLMMDKETGRPRGFGFVTFENDSAVDKALAAPEILLHNKRVDIRRATPKGNGRERYHEGKMNMPNGNNNSQSLPYANSGSYMQGGGSGGETSNQQYPYNQMAPAMMAQYLRQNQAYQQAMQNMNRGQNMVNPMMMMMNPAMMNPAMMQQMMQYQAMMAQRQGSSQQQATQSNSSGESASPDSSESPQLNFRGQSGESGSFDDKYQQGAMYQNRGKGTNSGYRTQRNPIKNNRGGYNSNGGYHPYNRT